MAGVAQWQSTSLWMMGVWVRNPSPAPKRPRFESAFFFYIMKYPLPGFVGKITNAIHQVRLYNNGLDDPDNFYHFQLFYSAK